MPKESQEMMTVADLKKALETVPDDAKIWVGKTNAKGRFAIYPANTAEEVVDLGQLQFRLVFDERLV